MEDNAENHDTSLYISHDAPHQGAHLPLGILHMGRHIVNEFIQTPLGFISIPINGVGSFGLVTIDDLLDAPAINQMLINNVDTNGNRTNTTHSAWQTELQAMGYPQQTRNIALSNASHCGNSQGLSSNQGLITVTGEGGTSVLTSIIELLIINIDPVIGIALNDVSAALLGFLPGNSNLDLEFRANTFPSSGTARIYKGRLTYEKRFLWLIPITRTIFNKSVNSQFNDKFIDNYPGGISPNGLAIANNGGTSNWFYNYDYNIDVNLNFDFIPVTSALDVGSGNANLNDSDYYSQYTSANPPTGSRAIPFANFTTSSNQNNNLNAEHISFNKRNGDWLAEELDADTDVDVFDCIAFCDSTPISGNDYLCTSDIYTINTTASTTWSISQGSNLVSLTPNGSTATLTQNNANQSGLIILNAFISSPDCGQQTITKQIWVGKPIVNIVHENYDPNYPIAYDVVINNAAQQHLTSVVWEKVSGQGTITTYPNLIYMANVGGGASQWHFNGKVTVTNACGTTVKYFTASGGGNPPCRASYNLTKENTNKYLISRAPSPCRTSSNTSSDKIKTKESYLINIFDIYGTLLYKTSNNSFNLEKFKSGIYIIKANINESKYTFKIIHQSS